jgi:hypothetical protein
MDPRAAEMLSWRMYFNNRVKIFKFVFYLYFNFVVSFFRILHRCISLIQFQFI